MTMKTGLLALGLLGAAGSLIVAGAGCSSDGASTSAIGNGGGGAAGASSVGGSSTANAGSFSAAGVTSTAGTNALGGTNAIGGTSANGGTNALGGTNANGGTNAVGGTNPNGGTDVGPTAGTGNVPGCPETMPVPDETCVQEQGAPDVCPYDTQLCSCLPTDGDGSPLAWSCADGGVGDAECPPDAMNGDPCTGEGLCPDQLCLCIDDAVDCNM